MNSEKGRIKYFDFLRGVAMIMVVGIHTYPNNLLMKDGIMSALTIILRLTFNCAVPLFLAISGYFIAKRNLNTFDECNAFWKKQIPTVYIPCLVFSLPWFILSCISTNWQLEGVLKKFMVFLSCGYSVYYFIALIIECYLLAPLLVRHNNGKTLVLVILLSIISTCLLEYVSVFLHYKLPYIVQGSFPILLIFFYLGIYLSEHSRDYSLLIPIIMMVAGLILGIYQMEWTYNHFGMMRVGQKISLYLFNAGIILLCMSKKIENSYRDNFINRVILYIGEISFGIYFTHVYLIHILDKYLPNMRLTWIILWLISLCLTIIIIAAIKKIAPSFSRKYLGYR